MACIHPLSKLYNELNGKLGDDDESKLRNLLTDKQISIRDMQGLKDPAAIFQKLEKAGFISEDNLQFLKTILRSIERSPLITNVLECEMELQKMKQLQETQKKLQEHRELEEQLVDGGQTKTLSTDGGITSSLGATSMLDYLLLSLKGSKGQIEYMGRTIEYDTKGRFHSLSEPLVFDCVATDVASNTSKKKNHFQTADEAAKATIRLLIEDLKSQNIISQ
ncbi:uncharacterized protein LOC100369834 [Saccoglossus kowalevskii]|uniref:Uncharacterized protein LOC100369834 n=1 Tax=Saccoglossus kowalevskii TaxID=10224 RepID=A0ABM0GWN0_SACKO|nr:PREDICTED: uncharacterized protein LOC100369834 [Saccoglossus kowalevskii]